MEGNNVQIANRLLSDPDNLVLWHCYSKRNKNIFFSYGITAEWFAKKELLDHGMGLYAFYKPDGASKECKTNSRYAVMKGVLRGKFTNFLIFDRKIATQYYSNSDIRTQAEELFVDEDIRKEFLSFYYKIVGSYELDAPVGISKMIYNKFGTKLRTGNIRGIVLNSEQKQHACIIYNPREFIPVFATNEKCLNASGTDFDNWELKVNEEMLAYIAKFPDYFSYGERLKAEGLIKTYTALPPRLGFICVRLKNGRYSFYDINANRIISQYGFSRTFGFEEFKDGTIAAACEVKIGRKREFLYVVPFNNDYCLYSKEFIPLSGIRTLKDYDSIMLE